MMPLTEVDKRRILGLSPTSYEKVKVSSEEIVARLYQKPSMSFAEIVKATNPPLASYCELYQSKMMKLNSDNETIRMSIEDKDYTKLSEQTKELLRALKGESWLMHLEILMQIELFGAGPKVFRPTTYQLLMLEKMNLNLLADEFQMPFKVIAIELPPEYVAMRATPTHKPFVSLLYFDKVFIHSLWSSKYVVKSWWRPESHGAEIEQWFTGKYNEYVDPMSLPTEEAEGHMEQLVRRAALNYCLLLDEVGIKRNGPAVPNQYSQLVKWCQKSNEHTKQNKVLLQCSPMLYSMAAETKLVRIVDTLPKEEGEPTGRVVSPHCRRGHYRMQAYGPQGVLRKRIRIPLVMVNAHMLASGLIPPEKVYVT